MARAKKPEEHENHERWLVSYADFITLLFAFFVVMYAISSVNEGKYRTLAHSLVAAFQTPSRAIQPIQVGELARSKEQPALEIDKTPHNIQLPKRMPNVLQNPPATPKPQHQEAGRVGPSNALQKMAKRLVKELQPLIDKDLVTVRQSDLWLEVEINTSILFPSASDQLSDRAAYVLERVADVVRDFPNPIRVEGFTDSLPISTPEFESNWELSAERAARVVRLFSDHGVAPSRMAAVGFGQYRPVADNDTPAGRRKNRRVSVVILAGHDTRYMIDVARKTSEIGDAADKPDTGAGAGSGSGAAEQRSEAP